MSSSDPLVGIRSCLSAWSSLYSFVLAVLAEVLLLSCSWLPVVSPLYSLVLGTQLTVRFVDSYGLTPQRRPYSVSRSVPQVM